VLLARNRESGASADAASLTLEDVRIAGTLPRDGLDHGGGVGLFALRGATVDGARIAIEQSHEAALVCTGDGTVVTLTDVTATDTSARATDDLQGWSFEASDGGALTLTRAVSERATEAGVLVTGGRLVAEDLRVSDTRTDAMGRLGHAMTLQYGGVADITRAVFEQAWEVAIVGFHAESVAHLADVVVADVHAASCPPTDCLGSDGGHGVGTYLGASISLDRFEIRRAEHCGIQLAGGGTLDLVHGEVTDSLIGACLQDPGFDVARVSNDVRYLRNDRTLEATMLPVPTASVPPR